MDLKANSLKALSSQIVGIHEIAGILTGTGELCQITPDQADAMTEAVAAVMAQHKIKPNPKAVAWINLASIMGVIYMPKILIYRQAKKHIAMQSQGSVSQPAQPNQTPSGNGPALKFV